MGNCDKIEGYYLHLSFPERRWLVTGAANAFFESYQVFIYISKVGKPYHFSRMLVVYYIFPDVHFIQE